MTERKVGRRDAIALAPCHRLVAGGAGGLRVSEVASKSAKKAVKHYLKHLAEKASAHAQEHKKKTVSLDMVVKAAVTGCSGVTENDVRRGHQGGEKGLAKAGVVRQFQKHCSLRVTDDAKKGLLAACEAYLRALGMRASMMVKSAKRGTILARDLDAAERLTYA